MTNEYPNIFASEKIYEYLDEWIYSSKYIRIYSNIWIFVPHCFWVWLQFDLSSFVTICFFEFCYSLSSWVLSQFFLVFSVGFFFFSFVNIRVFFSCFTIWIFYFCHHLSFQVLSQFEVLSFVTIWVLSFVTIFFFSFVIILVFEFCQI